MSKLKINYALIKYICHAIINLGPRLLWTINWYKFILVPCIIDFQKCVLWWAHDGDDVNAAHTVTITR